MAQAPHPIPINDRILQISQEVSLTRPTVSKQLLSISPSSQVMFPSVIKHV